MSYRSQTRRGCFFFLEMWSPNMGWRSLMGKVMTLGSPELQSPCRCHGPSARLASLGASFLLSQHDFLKVPV